MCHDGVADAFGSERPVEFEPTRRIDLAFIRGTLLWRIKGQERRKYSTKSLSNWYGSAFPDLGRTAGITLRRQTYPGQKLGVPGIISQTIVERIDLQLQIPHFALVKRLLEPLESFLFSAHSRVMVGVKPWRHA